MPVPRSGLVSCFAFAVALACATESELPPGMEYAERDYVEFPETGVPIADVVASLVPARATNAMLQARDVRVMRIDSEPWTTLPAETVRGGAMSIESTARYAIVASFNCQALVNGERFYNEQAAWYLLPGGKLAAWDHYDYGDSCGMENVFEPARGPLALDEKLLVSWIEKNMPRSASYVTNHYARGLAYALVGRLSDARAMLAAGDAATDASPDLKAPTREGRGRYYTRGRDAERSAAREHLVRMIESAADTPAVGAEK